MNALAIINEIFDILWLSGVLILLILIWRNSVKRTAKAQQSFIDLAMRDSESARVSADSAHTIAESIHALIAIIQSEKGPLE